MDYSWQEIGIVIIIASFLGFWVENIWLALTKGYMDNRNMNLPFLLGYGLAITAIYLLFGIPSEMTLLSRFPVKATKAVKIVLYFFCSMLCVSVGEVVLGTVTEKICHIEYWNYSRIPLHITKYTSVPTSIGFALMIIFFMEKVFPLLMNRKYVAGRTWMEAAIFATLFGLIADFLYCSRQMVKNQNFYKKWVTVVSEKAFDNIDVKKYEWEKKVCFR